MAASGTTTRLGLPKPKSTDSYSPQEDQAAFAEAITAVAAAVAHGTAAARGAAFGGSPAVDAYYVADDTGEVSRWTGSAWRSVTRPRTRGRLGIGNFPASRPQGDQFDFDIAHGLVNMLGNPIAPAAVFLTGRIIATFEGGANGLVVLGQRADPDTTKIYARAVILGSSDNRSNNVSVCDWIAEG